MPRKPALANQALDATGTTRASAVYDALRADILHGDLKPDEKLKVDAVGTRYGVGASPVREALNRLSAEGLVTRSDQRGFSVAALQWDDLNVLTNTRCQVEAIALNESIAARNPAWEDSCGRWQASSDHAVGRSAGSRRAVRGRQPVGSTGDAGHSVEGRREHVS